MSFSPSINGTESAVSPPMSPGKAPTLARAATLAQIAKHVGVSQVAVSVVLNNSRSRSRVSESTRQRILEAARELNYQPNVLARSLMTRRTNIIGFCSVQNHMFDPLYPFFGSILHGLLAGCEEHKKNFLVHGTFASVSEDDVYLEVLNGQIDGLVLYACELSSFTKRLAESHLPVVTVADAVPGLPCVTVDDEQGGRLLAAYLAEKGYRRALYWAPGGVLPSSIELRISGLREEANEHGIEVELYRERTPYNFAHELNTILSSSNRPDVLCVYSDFTAHVLLGELNALGVRVPEDIAVTGFDGFTGTFGASTGFTTVRAPWSQVAQTAVSLLVRQCEGEAVPMHTQLPVELVVGQTA